LLQAKDAQAAGELLILGRHIVQSDVARAILDFEKSRKLFTEAGDVCEAAVAENWTAQLLPDVGRISESRERFANVIAEAKRRKFNILQPPAYYWLGVSDYRQSRL
jgi:hypothetical protein